MLNIAYNTLVNYYDALSKYGYVNYDNVYRIIAYVLLYEFTEEGLFSDLETKDQRVIERFMQNLQRSSCLIPTESTCSD